MTVDERAVGERMRIAIMQPYFFPYLGYFRLFASTDLFVVFDDVQFPRRGWVHRNRLTNSTGDPTWFTLPLEKAPRAATIAAQRFRSDAESTLREQARRFPILKSDEASADGELLRLLFDADPPLVEYLVRQLTAVCRRLGLSTPVALASEVGLARGLRGTDRLIALAQAFDADTYVNAPGGRDLYDPVVFSRAGLELRFLSGHVGSSVSMLERLLSEPADRLRDEVVRQSALD